LLMRKLEQAGITVPRTRLASDGPGDVPYPLVIKPRTGRGSKGLGIVNSAADLSVFLAASEYRSDQLLIQEYVDGPEFTVSVVAWRDGIVQAVVPKEVVFKSKPHLLYRHEGNAITDSAI